MLQLASKVVLPCNVRQGVSYSLLEFRNKSKQLRYTNVVASLLRRAACGFGMCAFGERPFGGSPTYSSFKLICQPTFPTAEQWLQATDSCNVGTIHNSGAYPINIWVRIESTVPQLEEIDILFEGAQAIV